MADIWSVASELWYIYIWLVYIPHFLQKSPVIHGSFAERDLQYQIPLRTSDLWRASNDTAHCIWAVISSISNLHRCSRSLGLFCHVSLKRDQGDWDWRFRWSDTPNAVGCIHIWRNRLYIYTSICLIYICNGLYIHLYTSETEEWKKKERERRCIHIWRNRLYIHLTISYTS